MQSIQNYEALISEIVAQTRSELIYFFVLVLIGLILVFIPYYTLKRKWAKENTKADLAEKQLLIDVINRNTDVISTLKTTIDANNIAMATVLSDIEKSTTELNKEILKISVNQNNSINKIDSLLDDNFDLKEYISKSSNQYKILIELSQYIRDMTPDIKYIKNHIENLVNKSK